MSHSKLIGTGLSVALLLTVSALTPATRANAAPPPPTNGGPGHGGNPGGGGNNGGGNNGGTQHARPFFINGTISAVTAGTMTGTEIVTVTPAPRPTSPGGTTTTTPPAPVVITVTSSTIITGFQHITFADITAGELNVGDRIEVSGVPSGITATNIFSDQRQAATPPAAGGTTTTTSAVAPPAGPDTPPALGTVHITGTVAALPTQAAPDTLMLMVGDNTIPITLTATTTLTLVTTLTLADLTSSDIGDGISAFGTTASDGSLPAVQVTITPPPPAVTAAHHHRELVISLRGGTINTPRPGGMLFHGSHTNMKRTDPCHSHHTA